MSRPLFFIRGCDHPEYRGDQEQIHQASSGMIRKGDKKSNRLEAVPGIGKSLAKDLRDLDIKTVSGLRGRNPEKMYKDLCLVRGAHQDRCVLYVFRSAVYFAETDNPDPELVKWWNWKDRK